jgi:NTP pyrophosphatase (non-canonical NTP hydrolase)
MGSASSNGDNKQKLEQKLGEAMGLEMAAQKAVEELSSKGLLDKGGMKSKLERMKKEANNHQTKLEGVIKKLSQSEKEGRERSGTLLNSDSIQDSAKETEQKASQIMQTYLGNEPDSSEAIEFLCLAETGEVTHYEVLDAIMKKSKFKNKQQLATQIKSILGQEKKHLQLCTKLAKQNAILQ